MKHYKSKIQELPGQQTINCKLFLDCEWKYTSNINTAKIVSSKYPYLLLLEIILEQLFASGSVTIGANIHLDFVSVNIHLCSPRIRRKILKYKESLNQSDCWKLFIYVWNYTKIIKKAMCWFVTLKNWIQILKEKSQGFPILHDVSIHLREI